MCSLELSKAQTRYFICGSIFLTDFKVKEGLLGKIKELGARRQEGQWERGENLIITQ